MKNKILSLVKRYLVCELISALCTYVLAWLAELKFNNPLITSFAGSFGAFAGFYLTIYIKELRYYKLSQNISGLKLHKALLKNLFIEFGLSELLDLFITRPLCLYASQILIPNFAISVVTGSIIANIFFFGISGYMFSKKEKISEKLSDIIHS